MSVIAEQALQSDPYMRWFKQRTIEQYQLQRLERTQAGLLEKVPPPVTYADFNYDGVLDELNIRNLSYETLSGDPNDIKVPLYTVGDYKVLLNPDGTTAAIRKTEDGYALYGEGKTRQVRPPKQLRQKTLSQSSGVASLLESLLKAVR